MATTAESAEVLNATWARVRTRVLIIGATGLFGRRIAAILAAEAGFDLLLAGRREQVLADLVGTLVVHAHSTVSPLGFDIDAPDLETRLANLRPDLLIHAAGPFQGQDYRVAEAAIACRIHYLDLADGREFVDGIAALDAAARAAKVLVLSGASTVPALSGAVIRELAIDLPTVESIDIGIAPGNRTERGIATVRAILSYCGRRIPAWRQSRRQWQIGWLDLHRHDYRAPVGARWLSAVDVPDLTLLPKRYPRLQHLRIGAGLELSILHLGLWLLSGLVRWRLWPNLDRFALPMKQMADWLTDFGTDAGAMHVRVSGRDRQGRDVSRRFELIAERGLGPSIPGLAAVIIACRLRADQQLAPGARAADTTFAYLEFAAWFARLGILAGLDGESPG